MDIVVTTPKSEMAEMVREAQDVIDDHKAGLTTRHVYYRNLGRMRNLPKDAKQGDRIYYVEDGAVRGFCIIDRIDDGRAEACAIADSCESYIIMFADTWKWIRPIPMRGFQGWRYFRTPREEVHVVGDWTDPRPVFHG